jgi:hypothetical protein
MVDSNRRKSEFVNYVRNPDSWRAQARAQKLVADHLQAQATALVFRPAGATVDTDIIAGFLSARYLHAGLAIENAAKAIHVACRPNVVANDGGISWGPSHGHQLLSLVSELLPDIDAADRDLLNKLEDYVVWAGRYPAPKRSEVFWGEAGRQRRSVAYAGEWNRFSRLLDRLLNWPTAPSGEASH